MCLPSCPFAGQRVSLLCLKGNFCGMFFCIFGTWVDHQTRFRFQLPGCCKPDRGSNGRTANRSCLQWEQNPDKIEFEWKFWLELNVVFYTTKYAYLTINLNIRIQYLFFTDCFLVLKYYGLWLVIMMWQNAWNDTWQNGWKGSQHDRQKTISSLPADPQRKQSHSMGSFSVVINAWPMSRATSGSY